MLKDRFDEEPDDVDVVQQSILRATQAFEAVDILKQTSVLRNKTS